jgi:hypothetical protein
MTDKKKSLKKQPLDVNEWLEDYSAFMADEAMKLLKAQGKKKGDHEYKALVTLFVYRILATVLIDTLHERPESFSGATNDELFEANKKAYGDVKHQIQEAVGMAFTTAMSHYSGRVVDFYCQVKPVPEVQNGLSN